MIVSAQMLRQGLENLGLGTEEAARELGRRRRACERVGQDWAKGARGVVGLARWAVQTWAHLEEERAKLRAEVISNLGGLPEVDELARAFKAASSVKQVASLSARTRQAENGVRQIFGLPFFTRETLRDDDVADVLFGRAQEAEQRAYARFSKHRASFSNVSAASSGARARARLRRLLKTPEADLLAKWPTLVRLLFEIAGDPENERGHLEVLEDEIRQLRDALLKLRAEPSDRRSRRG